MTDFSKINDQIEAIRRTQEEAELKMIAESNARLEKARREAEEKRINAEKRAREASEAQRIKKQQAEEAKEAAHRAEQDRIRAEETKQNFQQEAKQREQAEADALKGKLEQMRFQHEQAIKKMQDEFAMAIVAEQTTGETDETVNPDGSQLKPVLSDGTRHPLDHFRQNVNH